MSYYQDDVRLAHVTLKCFYKCGDLPEILPMVSPSDKTDRAKPKCVIYYNICTAGFQEIKIIFGFFRKALYYIYAKGLFFKHNLSIISQKLVPVFRIRRTGKGRE